MNMRFLFGFFLLLVTGLTVADPQPVSELDAYTRISIEAPADTNISDVDSELSKLFKRQNDGINRILMDKTGLDELASSCYSDCQNDYDRCSASCNRSGDNYCYDDCSARYVRCIEGC